MFLRTLDADSNPVLGGIVADMMYQLKTSESSKLAMRIVHDTSSEWKHPIAVPVMPDILLCATP